MRNKTLILAGFIMIVLSLLVSSVVLFQIPPFSSPSTDDSPQNLIFLDKSDSLTEDQVNALFERIRKHRDQLHGESDAAHRIKLMEQELRKNLKNELSAALTKNDLTALQARFDRLEKTLTEDVSKLSNRIDTIYVTLFGAILGLLLLALPWAIAHWKEK